MDTTGLSPGVYSAIIFVQSNSGRQSTILDPGPADRPRLPAGCERGRQRLHHHSGDTWARDKAFTPGSWGYVGKTSTTNKNHPIAATDDDPLYQDYRSGSVVNYRFTVPNGTYQLELRFAELKAVDPNDRIFDVVVEGQLAIPALDIADEVGDFTADDHTVVVEVTDGVLNVRIIARQGFMTPILNGLRATDRPDL